MVQQRFPELCFLCVRIPSVDIVVHGLAKVGKLGEIESIPDGLLEGIPGTVEVTVQITTGMAAHHRDPQTGNEFGQCTVTALLNICLQAFIGLHAEALCPDDLIPVLFQLVQVTEVSDPAMANELGQGSLRQAFDVHPGLLTEVREFLNELGCTVGILTEKLTGTAGGELHIQFLTAAGTNHGQFKGVAHGVVRCDLRDDLIGLVDLDLIAHTKLEFIEDVQVVQVSPGYDSTVDGHRFKQACDTHHTGSGRSQLNTQESGLRQFIRPLQSNHAILMMTGGSQTGSIYTIVVFHDQTVYGILELLRVVRSDSLTQQLIIAVAIYVGKGHYGEASILKHL